MLSWDKTPALARMRCARAWVEIDLAALADNVKALKDLLPKETDLMSVVKADAYGHGAVTVAQVAIASGATWLGVATVPEGIELREAGIRVPILVMGAVNDPVEVSAIARWNLQPTIVNPKQALIFSETLASLSFEDWFTKDQNTQKLSVHLKLDTGMSRLGFSWQKAVDFARFVHQLPHLEAISVYSHLATADSPDPSTMRLQHTRFEQAISDLKQANLLPPKLHLANSAATLADPSLHYDMVRVGLATYGLYPAPHLKAKANLKPVLSVKARITHIKQIKAGSGVSYSHKFIAKRDMTIAIVGIGYADGVPRLLSNQLKVAVINEDEAATAISLVSQLGAITMDQIMLDVSDVPAAKEGGVVTLLGQAGEQSLGADQWAEMASTISWEILCGFKHRLPRITLPNQLAYHSTTISDSDSVLSNSVDVTE
ncbi:MAG: alanine racemase [Cyanobacteria bacterium J06629_19]